MRDKKSLIDALNERGVQRIAIYLRKSRDDKDEDDVLVKHRDDVLRYFDGAPVALTFFEEIGSSERFWKRPELLRLFDEIEQDKFDAVAVVESGRLTKSNGDFENFVELMKDNRCYLIITNNKKMFDLTDSIDVNQLTFDVFAKSIHQKYTKEILNGGVRRSAEEGNWVGGEPPYGFRYNSDTKRLDIFEPEARVVRLIFDLYVHKKYKVKAIERYLDERGVRNKHGKKIWNGSIYRMLKNEAYIGTNIHSRYRNIVRNGKSKRILNDRKDWIIVPNSWEAIIPVAVFDKAEEVRKGNAHIKGHTYSKVYYRSSIYCKACGAKRKVTNRGARRGDKFRIYLHPCKCGNGGATVTEIDKFVKEFLLSDYKPIVDGVLKVADNVKQGNLQATAEAQARLSKLRKELASIDNKIARAFTGYEEGAYTATEFKERKEALLNNKRLISEEIVKEESKTLRISNLEVGLLRTMSGKIRNILKKWEKLTDVHKRQIYDLMVERIEYNNTAVKPGNRNNQYEVDIIPRSAEAIAGDVTALKAISEIDLNIYAEREIKRREIKKAS